MNILDVILNETENEIFKLNCKDFKNIINEYNQFFSVKEKNSINSFISMKKDIYYSNQLEAFFVLLKKYNYNEKSEIKELINELGKLRNPNRNKEIISLYLNSPVIQDVSFNGKDTFKIISEKYGEYIFKLATRYFKKNKSINKYLKYEFNDLQNRCHEHTYFLSKILLDSYSITSFCTSCLNRKYHHSYTFDEDSNQIFDLCYNAVIDKEVYYKLFEPIEISVIKNINVLDELEIVCEKSDQDYTICALLRIAIYKEFLKKIGFNGELKDAPNIKEYIKNNER